LSGAAALKVTLRLLLMMDTCCVLIERRKSTSGITILKSTCAVALAAAPGAVLCSRESAAAINGNRAATPNKPLHAALLTIEFLSSPRPYRPCARVL